MPRADASEPLLDAAERLFAQQGIAQVSDRKIAEAAGNSNHSAVRYYFGGRDGLLEAMLQRHSEATQPIRRRLFEESTSLEGDIRAMVLPQVQVLADLGTPSWRARCMALVYQDPVARQLMQREGQDPVTGRTIFASVARRLAHLDQEVVTSRARLMGHLIITSCSVIEEQQEKDGVPAAWTRAGWFLSDAVAGMLQAPISVPPEG
ncbi:MAG: TetR/AcrR family transcriptional regulator [Nocardioides sp.]|uniref:TetR/AcrR family transcriptional regulator n=1 Tax=Nocardioides sp. TaxID=35761 RepID=UPI003F0339CE